MRLESNTGLGGLNFQTKTAGINSACWGILFLPRFSQSIRTRNRETPQQMHSYECSKLLSGLFLPSEGPFLQPQDHQHP